MKVKISQEEWFPVYCIDEWADYIESEVEISDEQYKRWRKAFEDFKQVQAEIKTA
jgi:hypothetical protein